MTFEEIVLTPQEYERLVTETFGGYKPHVQHRIIVCKEGDTIVGILNYFQYGVDVMFLHRSWFAGEYQKKIKKLKYWIGFYDYARNIGYKYIMGVIDSRNIPALIWALKTGFQITGTRQAIDKSLIVEIIKEI